jgi:hypothetical protein
MRIKKRDFDVTDFLVAFGAISFISAIVIFILGLAVFPFIWAFGNEQTQVCTVEEKDRGGSSGTMRLYSEDCEILEFGDVWLRGHFNSADLYQEIEEGKTYELTTVGWRIPIISGFPDIIEVKEVK